MIDNSAAGWVTEVWAKSLTNVLSSMTGAAAQYEVGGPALLQTGQAGLFFQHLIDSESVAGIAVHARDEAWQALGTLVLNSAGIDEVLPSEARNAFLEIATQSVMDMKSALSQRLGIEVSWQAGAECESPADAKAVPVQLSLANGTSITLELVASATLIEMLEIAAIERSAPEPAEPVEPEPSVPNPGPQLTAIPRTLDLLLDVELPVSVSFGRAQIRIKEVLKLTTGSIVELHRSVTEPVEVIVNNCVIARGEVVVVEGNYGVRIHEIVSRHERLRTTGHTGQVKPERVAMRA